MTSEDLLSAATTARAISTAYACVCEVQLFAALPIVGDDDSARSSCCQSLVSLITRQPKQWELAWPVNAICFSWDEVCAISSQSGVCTLERCEVEPELIEHIRASCPDARCEVHTACTQSTLARKHKTFIRTCCFYNSCHYADNEPETCPNGKSVLGVHAFGGRKGGSGLKYCNMSTAERP